MITKYDLLFELSSPFFCVGASVSLHISSHSQSHNHDLLCLGSPFLSSLLLSPSPSPTCLACLSFVHTTSLASISVASQAQMEALATVSSLPSLTHASLLVWSLSPTPPHSLSLTSAILLAPVWLFCSHCCLPSLCCTPFPLPSLGWCFFILLSLILPFGPTHNSTLHLCASPTSSFSYPQSHSHPCYVSLACAAYLLWSLNSPLP